MSSVLSILDNNSIGILIDIESHLSKSLPNIVIVGFANKSVDEAKERIRGALASSNIKLPKQKITVNLAPADLPKEGSYLDLPILISILKTSGIVSFVSSDVVVMGEVGLDGSVRPIRGVIGKVLAAKKLGINKFWIPKENEKQVSLIPGVKYIAINNISEIYSILSSENPIEYVVSYGYNHIDQKEKIPPEITFDEVIGQEVAKRAMVIAASGHHNIMLNGAPGAGKSMLAKALSSIMPPLNQEEILEVTHLHSLSDRNYDKIIENRPFRSPHHSASPASIIGGGQNPRPGEISLAHKGILLFDEFPEFSRSVIESLRQPIEDGHITVSRAKDTINFPSEFLLVATSNPCPCGFFGTQKDCICTPMQILKYQKKMSGPILDRIDLYVDVEEIDNSKLLLNTPRAGTLLELQKLIIKSRNIQLARQNKLNSKLSNKELRKYAYLTPKTKIFLDQATEKMKLSARSYIRTLRIARTIADLESSKTIDHAHVSEALQYRKRITQL